jgi:Tripartite tricarboxylate transporter TctA family
VLGYQLRPGLMPLIMSAPRIRAMTASPGIASFWIGNVRLLILNVPMIGVWVRLLRVPYKYLFPAAPFFIAVGVYSTKNSLFDVGEVSVFGVIGALLLWLDFPISPIALGFVLGPMLKETFPTRDDAFKRRHLGIRAAADQRLVHWRLRIADPRANRRLRPPRQGCAAYHGQHRPHRCTSVTRWRVR